jgi:predicted nucleic acid-binding protein
MEIDQKFHELALGLVDGVVAAVAERLRVYRVLTIDRDDFGPLRVGQRFTQRLEIVP